MTHVSAVLGLPCVFVCECVCVCVCVCVCERERERERERDVLELFSCMFSIYFCRSVLITAFSSVLAG